MAHYFTNEDNIKNNFKEIKFELKGREYQFITNSGVFSKDGLDFGTKTLLNNLPLEKMHGKILDFGCGYGVIGIFLALNTDAYIDMVDINLRALKLAKDNSIKNKANVNIYESNIYTNIKNKYNYIVTNPPIRVGKKILYEILFDAKKHLLPKGELWLVINKDQGAKTAVRDLEKIYKVEIVDKNKGFFVIRCQNDWQIEKIRVEL